MELFGFLLTEESRSSFLKEQAVRFTVVQQITQYVDLSHESRLDPSDCHRQELVGREFLIHFWRVKVEVSQEFGNALIYFTVEQLCSRA